MAEEIEGVAAEPEAPPADVIEQEPIAAELPLAPDNRPAQNVLGEVNRKYTKIERQQEEILAQLRALQRPAPSAPVAQPGAEYTNEQLAQLASAGNAEAHRILVERQVRAETDRQHTAWTQQQQVTSALTQIMARYPQLSDASDPLTQAVYQARNAFLQNGWQPGPATDLEAIKAAIVNAPHLVRAAPSVAQTQEASRRATVTPQQSMDGAAPRRSPQQPRQQGQPLDKKLSDIAKRMDVKDPAGSLKRFQERQDAARSLVSPAVQQAVREGNA